MDKKELKAALEKTEIEHALASRQIFMSSEWQRLLHLEGRIAALREMLGEDEQEVVNDGTDINAKPR